VPPSKSDIQASIVIPVFNNLSFTKSCIESIFQKQKINGNEPQQSSAKAIDNSKNLNQQLDHIDYGAIIEQIKNKDTRSIS
jgi:hypothetical protein